MSTQTTNLGLVKPDLADNADISILNQNADKIDAALPFKFGIENGVYGYYFNQLFVPFGASISVPFCSVGTITLPNTRLGTMPVDLGYSPSVVAIWAYDAENQLQTYSVAMAHSGVSMATIGEGYYFQDGGYSRKYNFSSIPSGLQGHVLNITANGFTAMAIETYFCGKTAKYIAIGNEV